MAAGGVAAAALLAGGGWWALHDRPAPSVVAATAPTVARPAAYSPQDRRQSIIVLPFENSSGDPAQDSIAAAMTRDVIDRIAEDTTKPLVPAGTAAAYRGKPLDLGAIGRSLNVHFALAGNVRRQDGRMIVSATLYETADVRPVWSQRYDRPERPDTWDSITGDMAGSIDQVTMDAEVARTMREHPDSLDKRDLMFAANTTPLTHISKENSLARMALVGRALAIDPNYLWALRFDGRLHADFVFNGFSSDPDADLAYATKAVDRALLLAPNDYYALSVRPEG
jgi:adenylate cyclase